MIAPRPFSGVARESLLRGWLFATLGTVLTYIGAQCSAPLPFTPVPITFQVFSVLLCGLALGRRWGALAQVQYVAVGLIGTPVFALHMGGPAILFWPHVTGGYLLSYPVAAFVVGAILEGDAQDRSEPPTLSRYLLASAVGLAIIYGMGCTWLGFSSRPMLSPGVALMAGAGWFLAWDAVKALGAVAIAMRLRGRRGTGRESARIV